MLAGLVKEKKTLFLTNCPDGIEQTKISPVILLLAFRHLRVIIIGKARQAIPQIS